MTPRFLTFSPRDLFPAVLGAVTALVCFRVSITWLLVCGFTSDSVAALTCAAALGCLAATRLRIPGNRSLHTAIIGMTGILSVGAVWAVDWLFTFGAEIFAASESLPYAIPALGLVVPSAVLLALLNRRCLAARQINSWYLAGVAIGLAAPLLHTLVTMPLAITVGAAVVLLIILELIGITQSLPPQPANRQLTRERLSPLTSSLGIGIVGASLLRQFSTQFPLSPGMLCVAAIMMTLISTACLHRKLRSLWEHRVTALLLVLSVGGIPMVWEGMIHGNLAFSAKGHAAWFVLMFRSIQIVAVGTLVLLATIAVRSVTQSRPFGWSAVPGIPGTFLLGFSASGFLSVVDNRVLLLTGLALAWHPLFGIASRATIERLRLSRPAAVAMSACCGLFVCGTWLFAFPATADSTLLLFNSGSIQAVRNGMSTEMIPLSVSQRQLREYTGKSGTTSIWKTAGDCVLVRRNGMPVAQASLNPRTTPQPVADVLTAVLPAVLHPNANTVMLIGDDAGIGLKVCSTFPLHTILSVRSDRQLTGFVQKNVWPDLSPLPDDDDRITIVHETPALAVRRPQRQGSWDVIVCDSTPAPAAGSQLQFTRDFYLRIVEQLSPDGLLCQRVSAHDMGGTSLVQLVSTTSDVFERVLVVRLAPGELALLAGPAEMLDARLLSRMQKPHVSAALAACGWDWSQLAALPVVDTTDPVGLFEHVPLASPASVENAVTAFRLPLEVLRATNKANEIRLTFAPHQQRLADAAPRSKDYQEFARRYSAVIQQSEILTAFPDQPWPYRRSLRMEMQRNPRPAIEKIDNGKVTHEKHPLDERRMAYFVTLGETIQQAREGFVDPLQLRALSRFTETYEPLMSHFAHHELIRIHEFAEHPGPALELRHRMHTVYFTEPGDLSVRQVADAISQILDEPDVLPDVAQRFDHVNSMLQILVHRWEGRRGKDPSSADSAWRDVDRSLKVAERALSALGDWRQEVNLTENQIRLRRRFVNMFLVAPLRDYRKQILAHRLRPNGNNESPATQGPDDSDLPLLLDPSGMVTN